MGPSNRRVIAVAAPLALLTAMLQLGCQALSGRSADGVGLLPPPPKGQPPLSKYQPDKPYVPLAPGVLTRTVYQTTNGQAHRIEVRDLLVGPGRSSSSVTLPGAAVFEVRSGSGLVTTAGKRQEVATGATFLLSEGEAFTIENKTDLPITMRVHVFVADR